MKKPDLKIHFTDFWPVFNPQDNLFVKLLSKKYNLLFDNQNPDILFYSVFGCEHHYYNTKRIQFIGENIRPNFKECDYAFSFDYIDSDRHYRLPLYALYMEENDISSVFREPDIDKILNEKKRFCNFIYSNPGQKKRNEFFKKLSKYKKVDSGGRLYRNIDRPILNKIDFIKEYKFTISFENSSYPGYTTEKIFEPMIVGSLPIYWGNPLVDKDFNSKSFLNYFDYNNDEELIERIIEIDNDDNLLAEILKQPFFQGNKVNEFVSHDNILNKLTEIIESDIRLVSSGSNVFSKNPLLAKAAKNQIKASWQASVYFQKMKNFKFYKFKIKLDKIINKPR